MEDFGEDVVRAAGVVLLRPGRRGAEVLVLHRPHRADWSLPKGKLDSGEHVVTAAVRECDEETGYVPVLGPPLEVRAYVAFGQPKVVHYWAATIGDSVGFTPGDEVDEIRWLTVPVAALRLSYADDVDLARRAAALPPTSPMIVLRHAQAQKRHDFKGKHDGRRPLSGRGRTQAKALVDLLAAYGIREVHSSDSRRCVDTVRRYAKSIDTDVRTDRWVNEKGHERRPKAAARHTLALAARPEPLVLCSHRPVLPSILGAVATLPGVDPEDPTVDPKLPPAGFVVLHRAFDDDGAVRVVAVERHEAWPPDH
ncbi:MAG: NUDIX hydrolase [Candidatus Nanopelagicales bacterium]